MTGLSKSVIVTSLATARDITLSFVPSYYRISRKGLNDKTWNVIHNRPIGGQFVDQNVLPGIAYEYRIENLNNQGATAYVAAGFMISPPLRGKVILVISSLIASALDLPIAQLTLDLRAERWAVDRFDLNGSETPAEIKAVIKSSASNAAILLGHVPVFRSGNYSYDGHSDHVGSVAADTYYGDLTGDWSNSPNEIPGEITVAVGRIDFSRMTCYSNKTISHSEIDLTRDYLNENHKFRTGQGDTADRGLICDNFPDRDFSSNAWRNFPQLVDKVIECPQGEFFSTLKETSYLMSFACGGGQFTSMNGVGSSDDFATIPIKTVFLGLLGSYFLDWDNESNFLRAAIGSGRCLTTFGAGAPNVFLHRLAIGGTIGESMLLSMNNGKYYTPNNIVEEGLYKPVNAETFPNARKVHQALMGDPTLVLFPTKRDSVTPIPPPIPIQSMSKVKFIEENKYTQGNWVDKYGLLGYNIPLVFTKFPTGLVVAALGASIFEWSDPGSDNRALQKDSSKRIASTFYADDTFNVSIIANDGTLRKLSIYFVDWDKLGRRQRVEILDDKGILLNSRVMSNFQDGIWLVYEFFGSIVIRITKQGPANAVLMGLFFDSVVPLAVTPVPAPSNVIRVTIESRDNGKTFSIVQ